MFQINFVEIVKTHILRSLTFFLENCTVYEIMWKNIVEPEWPQMTIWRRVVRLHASKDTLAPAHASPRARAHTHARTHTQTHKNI